MSVEPNIEPLLIALLSIVVETRDLDPARSKSRKTEMLLADSGLTVEQIALVLGKNPGAVRKAIERGRTAS